MNTSKFIEELEKFKLEDDIYHVVLIDGTCYAYDVKADKRTYFTNNSNDADKGLTIGNANGVEIHHICVDGGMVTYGLEDYIGDEQKHGRFDSMLFDEQSLLLVEYKMDSTTSRDKGKWANFSHGMRQIKDYYLFMKDKLTENGSSITQFFANDHIIPFICMNNLPEFKPRANAQRMTEMVKFKNETGLVIQYGTTYNF